MNHCTNCLALTILITWNLLALRENQLIILFVNKQNLTLPSLINLTRDNLTNTVLILVIERVMLQLKNLRSQCLTKVQDSTATELIEVNLLTYILTYFIVCLYLTCICKAYFLILILNLSISHNHTVTVNLEVALIRVYNHVEVFVTTENLSEYIAEALLQNAHQCSTIDALGVFKLLESLDHIRTFFFYFSCCHSFT